MLRVTPVYGSRFDADGTAEAPSSTLIEYGGVRVLWNVGWWGEAAAAAAVDAALSTNATEIQPTIMTSIFPKLPDHDVLIVSDSTLNSLGGLPLYYERHFQLYKQQYAHEIPMYATFPTVKMGQMTLYDYHASISLDGGRPPYTLEQMDNAFSQLQTIKYSQSIPVHATNLEVNNETGDMMITVAAKPSLSITAHRAGHVVGGAFFVLRRLQDDTVVVITPPTYNIAKELHLDSATLLKHGATPDVLVTYPGGPAMKYIGKLYETSKGKKQIMKAFATRGGTTKVLLETILSVLRRDGHVLLPVDASGRVLELVLLLSQHWDKQRLGAAYNLVWLGPMVQNTLDFCRSQLEWMASQLGNQFDDSSRKSQSHPYALRNVHLCSSIQELDAVIRQNNNNPTCVLASGLSLDHGPARDLLLKWADNADHAIIFTDSSRMWKRRTSRKDVVMNDAEKSMQQSSSSLQAQDDQVPMLQRQISTTVDASTDATEHDDEDDNENTMMVGSAIRPEEKVSPFSAAAQLLQQWCLAKWEGREMDDSVEIDVNVPTRFPLAGVELKQFLAQEEAQRLYEKQQEEKRAMLREVELAKGQLRLGEENETTTTATAVDSSKANTGKTTSSSTAKGRPKKKSRFDSSLFIKFSKPLHLTFEVREEAVGVGQSDSTAKYGIGESIGRSGEVLEDDYGIAVKPERFTDIVSGVDPSKFAGGSGRIGEEVMRRGFGYGTTGVGASGGGGGGGATGNEEDAGELEDEMDEQAMEATDLSEGNGIIRGRNGRTPTKVTTVPRRLEVLAEIAYVPLEGRVDARAARQSVRALQPRQVIVMGGPSPPNRERDTELQLEAVDEVTILAEAAQAFATDRNSQVQTPSDGEIAELSVGHAAYSTRLIDTPYQTLEEKRYNAENGIDPPDPIEPLETKVGSCSVSLLDAVATGQKVALDGAIVLAPRPLTKAAAVAYPSVYVSDGEVLLTDLRSELIAQGMKAEYSAQAGYSQLVVNGRITVKKGQDSGRLDVEGPLCEDFYTVRSVICGQYVTL